MLVFRLPFDLLLLTIADFLKEEVFKSEKKRRVFYHNFLQERNLSIRVNGSVNDPGCRSFDFSSIRVVY